jgi:hypothetical protein
MGHPTTKAGGKVLKVHYTAIKHAQLVRLKARFDGCGAASTQKNLLLQFCV